MINKLKQTKRRAIQHTMQAMGKAEVTTRDEEFQMAVDNFKALEQDLNSILKALKDVKDVTQMYTARHAAVGCLMAAYFRGDQSPDSFRDSSEHLTEVSTRAHSVVQRSCGAVFDMQVVDNITRILEDSFQAKKKLIAQHDGLKVDLESYRRRVKSLQEKGKLGNDPEMVKFTTKLGRTQTAYDRVHNDLLNDLREMYNTRHEMLHPHFAALVASKAVLEEHMMSDMKEVMERMPSALIEPTRSDIEELITSGGPPLEDEEGGKKGKGLMKRGSRRSKPPVGAAGGGAADVGGGGGAAPMPQASYEDASGGGNYGAGGYGGGDESLENGGGMEANGGYGDTADYSNGGSSSNNGNYMGETDPAVPSADNNNSGGGGGGNPFYGGGGGEETIDSEYGVPANNETIAAIPLAETYQPPEAANVVGGGGQEVALALFDYTGVEEQDLSFGKGDRIVVMKKIDDGWWSGRKEDGAVGLFPSNYVRLESDV